MEDHHPQWVPPRPPTPQTLIHRLPDKPDPSSEDSSPRRPAKHIILIMGSTAVAGKVQIATTVAQALSCPLYQGDSLHESSAKAASLGAGTSQNQSGGLSQPPNKQRYKRMWLSKMTRTGLLFPEASRPAHEGSGSGTTSPHASSAASSRRGSVASDATSNASSAGAWSSTATTAATLYAHKPVFAEPDPAARERRANPALLVLTHPQLEGWHKAVIRESVGEYGIGVVFVPLYRDAGDTNEDEEEEEEEEKDLPVLKPLDPRTMTSFGSFGQSAAPRKPAGPSLDEEFVLKVDVEKQIEDLIQEIIEGVGDAMTVT
ncbi:hypothetical protein PG999_007268 [Apiospora kogelbergensis]|uniref:AAA domain-containing protein n=1 Tax=Apiospora kogelbergensis TaxID=1337665 RepID=A0AAW0QXS3_9PEZI